MPLTRFPFGVSSWGMPVLPGPVVVPNIIPSKTSSPGVFFVNGDYGSDGNSGLTPNAPLKNLDTAYNLCYGGMNEIIYVLGGTAAVSFSTKIASAGAGLVWAKNYTHCIGLAAPVQVGQRARITNGASTLLLTPLIEVRGNGCLFQNLEIANVGSHATEAAVCLLVTGQRNAFINCQISGGLGALTPQNAACRSLVIGPGFAGTPSENYFGHCYIGVDTVARTTTSSEIEIKGGAARTVFEDCKFSTYATGSGSGSFILTVDVNGIDRFLLLNRCQILNASVLSGGVALSNAFSLSAPSGGVILITGCLFVGVTATAATKTDIYMDNAYATGTTALAVIAGW